MSGLLISNTFDPKGKTPKVANATASSTSFADLINITGKGYLIGVDAVMAYSNAAFVKLVIDGATIIDGTIQFSGGHNYSSNSLPLIFRFESSLQVQIKVNDYSTTFFASYLLD